MHPSAIVAAGLTEFFVVATASDPSRVEMISSPSVMLVSSAPRRYPSISRTGFGRIIISVDAATSVGFNAAVNASTRMPPPHGVDDPHARERTPHQIAKVSSHFEPIRSTSDHPLYVRRSTVNFVLSGSDHLGDSVPPAQRVDLCDRILARIHAELAVDRARMCDRTVLGDRNS